jgi:hypothetical protein
MSKRINIDAKVDVQGHMSVAQLVQGMVSEGFSGCQGT